MKSVTCATDQRYTTFIRYGLVFGKVFTDDTNYIYPRLSV